MVNDRTNEMMMMIVIMMIVLVSRTNFVGTSQKSSKKDDSFEYSHH